MSETVQLLKKDLSKFGQILAVATAQTTLAQDLILIGFAKYILLGHMQIADDKTFDLDIITEFEYDFCTTSLSISPDTTFSSLSSHLLFAAVGTDSKIRVIKTDADRDEIIVLENHSSYVNDAGFDTEGEFFASTGDDCTIKIYDCEDFNVFMSFQLTSPGMSIGWHAQTPHKLLVAEKKGILRLYNLDTRQPTISVDYCKILSCAHWCPSNPQVIISLQEGELVVTNLSKNTVPLSLLFTEIGGDLKYSSNSNHVAGVNARDGFLKVINIVNKQLKLSVPVTIPTNICWHQRLPIVCIGDYTNLCFWKVAT